MDSEGHISTALPATFLPSSFSSFNKTAAVANVVNTGMAIVAVVALMIAFAYMGPYFHGGLGSTNSKSTSSSSSGNSLSKN